MHKLFIATKYYLNNFIKAQLIVTLVSFPILVWWGIPFSLMSLIGNFLFTPILTIFLVLSSLIFFTQLLCIPNNFLIKALSTTTSYWEFFLSFGKKTWLVGYSKPGAMLIILLVILGILLIFRFMFRILSKVVTIAIIIVTVSIVFHYLFKPNWPTKIYTEFVPHCSKKLLISQMPNKTIQIIDKGLFIQKKSPKNFINFELKPYLIKKFGMITIEKIILNNPAARSFKAAKELCNSFTVKEVSIIYFTNRLSHYSWKHFFSLKKKIEQEGGIFSRFQQNDEETTHRK